MLTYINGQIIPEEQATISVNDRGWLYGDAVFETMRTYNGRIFKLDSHLARLWRSAELIGVSIPLATGDMTKALDKLISAEGTSEDIIVRIAISRGAGGLGLFPVEMPVPTVVMQLRRLPDYAPETFSRGWSVMIAKTRRNDPRSIDPQIKSANFLNNILAKREAVEAGANEAIMLNSDGLIAESTVSNIFIAKEQSVITPPVSDGILPGITREIVLELGREAGLTVLEQSIDIDTFRGADEAFLTLTSAGLIPVVEVDDHPLGAGGPGPVFRELRGLYNKYVDEFRRGVI